LTTFREAAFQPLLLIFFLIGFIILININISSQPWELISFVAAELLTVASEKPNPVMLTLRALSKYLHFYSALLLPRQENRC
ncbi:MAG: hypothetical protein KDD45_09545, partial [Bdellovibrionales bacterium]|nr:hypothetical protein [Bdellovibrionales bacterium]